LGTSFGLGKIKIGTFGGKGFETRSFFSELMSVRLSEPSASSKRACPVDSGHSSLEQAVSELQANVTNGFWTVHLSELQASFKRASPEATEAGRLSKHPSLKRATPCSATFDFSLRALGDQSKLPRMFLLT